MNRSFDLAWTIAPPPVVWKGKTGRSEIRAETLPQAMRLLKERLSAVHHVPVERIEITSSASFHSPTTTERR
jgi:hypothetical protein